MGRKHQIARLPSGVAVWIFLGMLLTVQTSTASMLLRYTFDDQADPTANSGTLGAAYNGNLQGNATFAPFDAPGNYAVSLDGGTNDSVVIPQGSSSVFNIGNSDFSLYARFQTTFLDQSDTRLRGLIWKQATGPNPTYRIGVQQESGLVHFGLSDGIPAHSSTLFSLFPVNDGLTHEVLGVRDGNALYLFVDGQKHASVALPAGFGSTNNAQPLVIGGRTLGDTDDFAGLIDEVRVFNEAIPEPSTLILAVLGLLVGSSQVGKCRRAS